MLKKLIRLIQGFLMAFTITCAILPVVFFLVDKQLFFQKAHFVLLVNFISWCTIAAYVHWRWKYSESIRKIAKDSGIVFREGDLLTSVLQETIRTRSLLSVNLLEQRITNKQDLARALDKIVASAHTLLKAESAELALFDSESRTYHSSFVVGKPFMTSAQAMLSGAMEGKEIDPEPNVLIQPVAFAGTILGSLRIALPLKAVPSSSDRQILQLLAIQSGVAILNAQYTGELLRMKSTSEESIKAKTGFLANLSHELRAPLGIMMNATELVLDGICGGVTDEQAETLNLIQVNGTHLLELIDDVLDYAKIESGKLFPQKTTLLVHDITKDIFNVVRKQADDKNHTIRLRPQQEALAVSADRKHMRQILINLLTNAIKYTPTGGDIEIWSERIPGNKIKIHVKDNGIGIAASQRHKVFSAFERVEDAYALSQVGTGLGMSLTKRMVEVNGGSIDFESTPGKGTHFWLIFDATQPERDITQDTRTEPLRIDGKGNSLLLLQRADGERDIVAKYLKSRNFNIYLAESKGKAEQILKSSRIDIVVIDNNIIDNPQDDTVDIIRDAAMQSSLPLLLLSSRAFVFDIEKYLRVGVDRCLIKPLDLHALSTTCRELIDGTYQGDIIDRDELDLLANEKSREDAQNEYSSPKLLGIEDIIH